MQEVLNSNSAPVDPLDKPLTTVKFKNNGEKEERPYTRRNLEAAIRLHDFNKKSESAASDAKRKVLKLLGTENAPEIKSVKTPDGDEFFIRSLDAEGMIRVGLLSARNKEGKLFLEKEGHFGGLLAALLFVAACGDEDGTPLFDTREEAYLFAHSRNPEAVKIGAFLFQEIVNFNPDILPNTPQKKASNNNVDAEEEGDEDAFLEQSKRGQAPPN